MVLGGMAAPGAAHNTFGRSRHESIDGRNTPAISRQLAELYVQVHTLQEESANLYRRYVNLVIACFRNKPISNVTEIDVHLLVAQLLKKYSPTTAVDILRRLRTLFQFAWEMRLLKRLPTEVAQNPGHPTIAGGGDGGRGGPVLSGGGSAAGPDRPASGGRLVAGLSFDGLGYGPPDFSDVSDSAGPRGLAEGGAFWSNLINIPKLKL